MFFDRLIASTTKSSKTPHVLGAATGRGPARIAYNTMLAAVSIKCEGTGVVYVAWTCALHNHAHSSTDQTREHASSEVHYVRKHKNRFNNNIKI